jgi:hypothetical protein
MRRKVGVKHFRASTERLVHRDHHILGAEKRIFGTMKTEYSFSWKNGILFTRDT